MRYFQYKKLTVLFSLFLLGFLISGCDGGTSGSGVKTYQGRITSTNGTPLSNVSVTIESTGDSATTNQQGEFSLNSTASGENVPFIAEAPNFTTRFSVDDVSEESSRVSVNVQIDTEKDTATVTHISIKARFSGLCDYYFENREIIRQSNRVPAHTRCSITVDLLGDGKPLGAVPVALQYASCETNAVWETIATTSTGVGKFRGLAEIQFEYEDSPTRCRYRVLAPFNDNRYWQVSYPIDTFTEQGIFTAKP